MSSSPQAPTRLRREDLPMVYVERPRCPYCDSVDLATKRTRSEADGSASRSTHCRDCGKRFLVIVE